MEVVTSGVAAAGVGVGVGDASDHHQSAPQRGSQPSSAQAPPPPPTANNSRGTPSLLQSHSPIPIPVVSIPLPASSAPPAPSARPPHSEPEPARITSDIITAPTDGAETSHPALTSPSTAAHHGQRNQAAFASTLKRSAERRHALSVALKRRWDSGLMDHVHQKRLATLRMKKEAELAAERLAWQHHQGATSLSPGAGITSASSERLSKNLQTLFSERAHSAPSTQPAGKGAHIAFDSDDDDDDDELSDLADSSDLPSPGASSTTDSQEPRGSPRPAVSDLFPDPRGKERKSQNAGMGDGTKTTTPRPAAEFLRKTSELSGDWKTLWHYILPHLTCHKGPSPPERGWVRELITLPRVRDIQFNPKRLHTHPYRDTKDRDVSALIIQVTGEPAPEPCGRCREGTKGPFVGCIMVAREAHPFPLKKVFGCANCFYHYGQTYCSHKHWGASRAEEILQKRIADGDPITFLADGGMRAPRLQRLLLDSRSPSAVVDGTYQGSTGFSTLDPGAAAAPSDISAGSTTPTVATEKGHVAIETTPAGRRYDTWFDEKAGGLAPTKGALLPDGYEIDRSNPKPWICPVRTCRQNCFKKKNLSYHFQRAHFACLLNDNGDGTFTDTGTYMERHVSKSGKLLTAAYPIVISQNPIPSKVVANPKEQFPPQPSTEQPPPTPSVTTQNTGKAQYALSDPQALWEYTRRHLTHFTQIPETGFIGELLLLPRKRNLKFNPQRADLKFEEKTPRDVAALLIEVTGEKPPSPCDRCQESKGIFKKCVVIHRKASEGARERYRSCANCLYRGNQTYCTLKEWITTGRETLAMPSRKLTTNVPYVPESDATATRPSQPRELRVTPARKERTQGTQQASGALVPVAPAATSSLISAGAFQSVMEMETWEVAPGRIKGTSPDQSEDIAFSMSYLSTNQAVPVLEDVAFRVDTIRAGDTLQLEPDGGKTRICSIASGKVRVRTGDEPEFTIGPHGVFKIQAGTSCSVHNRMYTDAVLHTVVLHGFS